MGPGAQRRCRHCRADVPDHDLACPGCGRYFDGGFDLPDLIDGIRAVQPVFDDEPTVTRRGAVPRLVPVSAEPEIPDPVGDGWWSADEPPTPLPMGEEHDEGLPLVGEVADLPYADPRADGEVIDLRDPPVPHRTARSWLRPRSRS